jgi:hypothetical protein
MEETTGLKFVRMAEVLPKNDRTAAIYKQREEEEAIKK